MSRIKLTNSAIIVEDYTLGESEQLEKPFKIFDPITHKLYNKGLYYEEETKRLFLPAGMDLWFVRRALDCKYYDRISHTPYKEIENIYIKYKPRDEQQYEALRFMTGSGVEYENNIYQSQLMVSLGTGKGKTYCSIACISFFKIKSMIITSSNSLLDQWEEEILKYTNLKKNDIVRISGSEMCNMFINGSSKKAVDGKIFLCSHGTLRSFGDRYGWDKVNELFITLGIGMKFFDEAHTSYDNMLMIDFYTNVYKTYYVTATPGRSSWRENNIYQISLKNVPMIDLFDENNDPHTSYVAIKWNSNPRPQDISACKNPKYGLDRMKYIDYLTRKPEFYDMLRIIMDLVIKSKGRALMYIGTNDGILRVYHWIAENYPEFIGDIGIFTSLVTKENKGKEKKKKLLLSTTKSAGLGEHIEGLKMTIVLAEPFKSEIITQQTLGRTRDDNTMYVELVDMGFVYTKKFYYSKLPVFKKYATDVSDTMIDKYELEKRSNILFQERNHYQTSPIKLYDTRFDFDKVLPKKKADQNVPKCPVSFINNDTPRFFDK